MLFKKALKQLSVSKEEIAFMLFNVYSTIIIKTNALTAIFDPVRIEIDPSECEALRDAIDVIIVTHEHVDHFNEDLVIRLQKATGAKVLTTPFITTKLCKALASGYGEDKVKALRIDDSVYIKDTTFHAFPSLHPAILPLSFIIKTNCATIYHPDDSKLFAGMTAIRDKYKPDVMLYTGTSAEDMVEIAKKIRPKVVVSYADPRFEDMRLEGVNVKMLKQFEIYKYATCFNMP